MFTTKELKEMTVVNTELKLSTRISNELRDHMMHRSYLAHRLMWVNRVIGELESAAKKV